MKQIRNKLSVVILFFVAFISTSVYSQNQAKKKNMFVRVYDLDENKLIKGFVVYANDSILGLKKGGKFVKVNIENIGLVKTKRSVGNSVLTGGLIGGATGALIGAITSKEETKTREANWLFGEHEYTTGTSPGTGAAVGGGVGLAGGALIGLGASLFKNEETFVINGDLNKWRIFKDFFTSNN